MAMRAIIMLERRVIAVRGVVQGVGFRPFVYGLAVRLNLAGFVKNRTGEVLIEVEGDCSTLDQFVVHLKTNAPQLARIESLDWQTLPANGDRQFLIHASDQSAGPIFVSPDVATCDDCLREMLDPTDRRYQYPFLNCTNCGPRLTIITGAPYDRPQTTMADFVMCDACRAEYEDPANRRFHAQPTCCRACGPRLGVLDGGGKRLDIEDPLAFFAAQLRAGKIGALKGLGGYHLACDARSEALVAELRRRKMRDEKPFAVMAANADAAEQYCVVSPAERNLLCSRRRPIVLLRKRSTNSVAESVAPGNPALGVMLPYTPLHHLLMRALGGMPLVMTSGNRADEPIAYDDADAVRRLAGIADLFLVHDRPIHVRCDDSVTRVVAGVEMPVRRSRGYAPDPIELPFECPRPMVAVGGQLKGTFALGRGRHAFVSHHLGDLDHFEAYQAFLKDLALYEKLFDVRPQVLVHDMHPDYASTRYARARSEETGVKLLAVQHHHAHMASCMAEHGLRERVIGVSFDGTGYGTDGAIWGGEFLVGDYAEYRRVAHLRYVGMPGGEQAIREPWRMALAHCLDAGVGADILKGRVDIASARMVTQMIERRFNTPLTSSAGRLFDAVATLATGRTKVSYEGQAAMELEWLAGEHISTETYPWEIEVGAHAELIVNTRPLIGAVVQDVQIGASSQSIASRFHDTMTDLIAGVCDRIRAQSGINTVVLSGGVFLNERLTRTTVSRLSKLGFDALRHQKVPPNDGGLSLGQLAIAAARC